MSEDVRNWWNSRSSIEKVAVVALGTYCILQFLAPLYIPIDGHDSPEQLYWIHSFHALQQQGVMYPRWLNESFFGLGAPTFYFYPPFTYLIGSALHFITPGASDQTIFQMLGTIGTIVSFIGCLKFIRSLQISKAASILGGLLYAFGPYRFFDLYIRCSIGEHFALAILPWLFLAIEGLLLRGKQASMFAMATLAWSLLLMTNLPTAALAAICIPIYLVIRRTSTNNTQLTYVVGALVLGTLCASIYLFPILQFYTNLNHSSLAGQLPGFSTGNAWLDVLLGKNLMSNRLYCSLMLASVLLLFARLQSGQRDAFHTQDEKKVLLGFRALLLFSLLVQLPYITLPLFSHLIPFSMIQFPWRWDGILLLSSGVLIAFLWEAHQRKLILPVVLLWSLGGLALLPFKVANYHLHNLPPREIVEPGEYLPGSAASRITPEVLRYHANDAIVLTDDSSIHVRSVDAGPTSRTILLEALHPAKATFHLFYWPQWELKAGDKILPLTSDSIGRITAQLPSGKYTVTLNLVESSSEKDGKVFSLFGICCLIGGTIFFRKRKSQGFTPEE